MKITITYELTKNGTIQGIVYASNILLTPYGKNQAALINSLKYLVEDLCKPELNDDKIWGNIDWDTVEFEFVKYPHERNKQLNSIARLHTLRRKTVTTAQVS